MLKTFTLRNFRTHLNTTVRLGPTTLLLGPNGGGKSNFLLGLKSFAMLARRSRRIIDPNPWKDSISSQSGGTFEPLNGNALAFDRHRLANRNDPIEFACEWEGWNYRVAYSIKLFLIWQAAESRHQRPAHIVKAVESMDLHGPGIERSLKNVESTGAEAGAGIATQLVAEKNTDVAAAARSFFRDMGKVYVYELEPRTLRQELSPMRDRPDTAIELPNMKATPVSSGTERSDAATEEDGTGSEGESGEWQHLGEHGENIRAVLLQLFSRGEERSYNRFKSLMEKFDPTFRDIAFRGDRLRWYFRLLGGDGFQDFDSRSVSDGFIRVSALSYLAAQRRPPAIMAIEEIENGISRSNLRKLLSWLRQTAATEDRNRGCRTQIILTTHSPLVLCEFADNTECVVSVRLENGAHRTIARSVKDLINAFADSGAIRGEQRARDGSLVISPELLFDLWNTGLIGGETATEPPVIPGRGSSK